MFELTPATAEPYLRERGLVGPGPVRITELADGVSNAVLRVETAGRVFVLKQSRPQLRTRDPWFSDLGRIWRERDVMQLLGPQLPPGVVPEVLFSDPDYFAFAMSHAPEPFRNWRSVLLGGEVDVALGEAAGWLLAAIHGATVPDPGPFVDRTVFEQLRVDPFYVRISQRLPDVVDAVAPLIDRCRNVRFGLCHGDFSPKNLLVHAGGFTLVDYETAHLGDVTFDLGFFLSHLLLKSVYRSGERLQFHELTRAFWHGYGNEELVRPGVAHLGACLLARVDGTSPAPYLTDEGHRDAVRRLGRRLLRERPESWDDVIRIARP